MLSSYSRNIDKRPSLFVCCSHLWSRLRTDFSRHFVHKYLIIHDWVIIYCTTLLMLVPTRQIFCSIRWKEQNVNYPEPKESTALFLGIKGSTVYIQLVILCFTTRSNLLRNICIWEEGDFSISTTKGYGWPLKCQSRKFLLDCKFCRIS